MPEIVIEKMLNGKAVDVAMLTREGWVAWEAQLEASCRRDLLMTLIERDLRAGFVRVVLVVQSRKDIDKVEAVVGEMASGIEFSDIPQLRDRVQVMLLAKIME